MAAMARQLQTLVFQLENVSSRSTVQRLALFLLRLCDGHTGDCRIQLPLDKNLIAARLGMQPETLSRALPSCAASVSRPMATSCGSTT